MKRYQTWGLAGLLVAIAVPVTWWGRQQVTQTRRPAIAALPSPQPLPTNTPTAQPQKLTKADETAIAAVIRQQLAAFKDDNADLAFRYASPAVQAQFQTADQFMAMVRSEYETVYHHQSISFEDIDWVHGRPTQTATLLGPSGEWMRAYYQMEQQTDDTWRIAGCILVPMNGETI